MIQGCGHYPIAQNRVQTILQVNYNELDQLFGITCSK